MECTIGVIVKLETAVAARVGCHREVKQNRTNERCTKVMAIREV